MTICPQNSSLFREPKTQNLKLGHAWVKPAGLAYHYLTAVTQSQTMLRHFTELAIREVLVIRKLLRSMVSINKFEFYAV